MSDVTSAFIEVFSIISCWFYWVLSQPESAASLIGSFLAATIAYTSIKLTEKNYSRRNEEREQQEIRYFLRGVLAEIRYVWERYGAAIGQHIQKIPENQALTSKISIRSDYFVFFHTNNFYLGKIKNAELQAQILDFYIQAKGLIDTLELNNHMLTKMEEYAALANEKTPNIYNTFAQSYGTNLVEYLEAIKEQDARIFTLTKSLILRLETELNSDNKL